MEGERTTPGDPDRTTDFQPQKGPTKLPEVPGYEIVRELGRGGMGVAYLARHLGLKRPVALKMLLHAEVAGSSAAARFVAEAEALAALRHPNIVPIYDRGEHNGLSYFAMEYCDGGSLADRITDSPLPPDEAARIVQQLARGVAIAHDRGILHRDLKPANVLFSEDGTPKISDFGLAKRLDSTDMERLTHTGAIIGTPSYMPPEQAEGKAASPAADVYALGAILYRLLAGRPPFMAASNALTLQLVLTADPVSPRQLNPAVPRDLETICLKCLSKAADHRYASASTLADDLGRYLGHMPIFARPAGWLERTWKWARRNPSRAAFVTAMALLLLTVAGASTLLIARELKAAKDLSNANQDLVREQAEKDLALRNERIGSARLALDRGLLLCEQGDIARGLVAMTAGLAPAIEAEASDVESAIRHNLAAWEREMWPLQSIDQGPPGTSVVAARIRPGGDSIAVALSNNTVELWPFEKHAENESKPLTHDSKVLQLDFSTDGRWLLTRTRSSARIWDCNTGTAVGQSLDDKSSIEAAALSPDGATIAIAGSKPVVHLWNVASGQQTKRELRQARPANLALFRPDGRELLTSENVHLRRWDVETGAPLGQPLKHDGMVVAAKYSRDGRWIVSGTRASKQSGNAVVYLWNAIDGKLLFESTMEGGTQPEVLFSPDGQMYAARSIEGVVQLRRTATGELVPSLTAQTGTISSISFSPDSLTLILGERSGRVRFWDIAGGLARGPVLYHQTAVDFSDFSADGRVLVTSDGVIRRWQIAAGTRRGRVLANSGAVFSLRFSPDGKQLLTGSAAGTSKVWSTESGERIAKLKEQTGDVMVVAFSPLGNRALTAGFDRVACIWDTTDWKVTARLCGDGSVLAAAISPNSDIALTGGSDSTVRLWDVASGRQIGAALKHSGPIRAVAFRPDGQVALCGGQDGKARLWRIATQESIGEVLLHPKQIDWVGFTPDGRLAITAGGFNQDVRLWESDTGKLVGSVPAPNVPAPNGLGQSVVAMSRDGRFILTGGYAPVIQLRLLATGENVGLPLAHLANIRAVAFAPDGQTVLTGSYDATARRWHVPTGFPVGPAMRHTQRLRAVDFSPDGRLCASGGWDGTASIWMAPLPLEGDPAMIRRRAEQLSGLSLQQDGSIQALDVEGWRKRQATSTSENPR